MGGIRRGFAVPEINNVIEGQILVIIGFPILVVPIGLAVLPFIGEGENLIRQPFPRQGKGPGLNLPVGFRRFFRPDDRAGVSGAF